MELRDDNKIELTPEEQQVMGMSSPLPLDQATLDNMRGLLAATQKAFDEVAAQGLNPLHAFQERSRIGHLKARREAIKRNYAFVLAAATGIEAVEVTDESAA